MASESETLFEEDPDPDLDSPDIRDEIKGQVHSGSWKRFNRMFLQKPGEHLILLGRTGSGKTHKLYYLVKKLIGNDTIVWFDTAKDYDLGERSELCPLFSFGLPIHIIHPAGCTVSTRNSPVPITYSICMRPQDLWKHLEPKKINIIMISRFFIEPELFAKYVSQAFRELIVIEKTRKAEIQHLKPFSIFHDELQDIAPGQKMTLSKTHAHAATVLAWNFNKLRSGGVRIVGATQSWTMVYPKVRDAFTWILCCRGASFERENTDLAQYNNMYRRLNISQGILWFPDRTFEDRWNFPRFEAAPDLEIISDGVLHSTT